MALELVLTHTVSNRTLPLGLLTLQWALHGELPFALEYLLQMALELPLEMVLALSLTLE